MQSVVPLILKTKRLELRELTASDAPFILDLVNDPAWLQHIGDRNVHNLDDARKFIDDGPRKSYRENEFGLWRVSLAEGGVPIGLCGVLKREGLDAPDLGYALLPAYRAQGYALEACQGTLAYAADTLGLSLLLAIVSVDNQRSIHLLNKLNFSFDQLIRLTPDGEEIALYRHSFSADERSKKTD